MGNVNCVSCTAPQKKSNKEVSPIKKRSSLYLSKKLSEGLEENQVNAKLNMKVGKLIRRESSMKRNGASLFSDRSTMHFSHHEHLKDSIDSELDVGQQQPQVEQELNTMNEECNSLNIQNLDMKELNEQTKVKLQRLVKNSSIHKNYEFQKLLGQGSYGIVHQAVDKKCSQVTRAVKSVLIKHESQFLYEFAALSELDHPNIIRILDIYEDCDNYHLLMDFCNGGDLGSYVKNLTSSIDEKIAASIIFQIMKALSHMHKSGWVHRDIKSENVLITQHEENSVIVKLCDFGFSTRCNDRNGDKRALQDVVGSPYYIAPEVLSKSYDQKCDLWSLGVVMYHLLSQNFPFKGENNLVILENIKQGTFNLEGETWNSVSQEAKSLLKRLLTKNPVIRIDLDDAFDSPWFDQLKESRYCSEKQNAALYKQINHNLGNSSIFENFVMTQIGLSKTFSTIYEINKLYYALDLKNTGLIDIRQLGSIIIGKHKQTDAQVELNFERLCFNSQQNLNYCQFVSLCLDYQAISSKKESLWNAFKSIQDSDSAKITEKSVCKLLELQLSSTTALDQNNQRVQMMFIELAQKLGSDAKEISFCEYMSLMSKKE